MLLQDYDYFYDYADFTIKPGNRPTTSSTTEATEKTDVAVTTEHLSSQNSTISSSENINSTEQSLTTLSGNEEVPLNADQSNGTTISFADDKSQDSQSSEEDGPSEAVTVISTIPMKPLRILRSQKRCKSGYVPNGDGRCRLAGRPWLSLVP